MRIERQPSAGLTLLELLSVTAIILILVGMLLPAGRRPHGKRINCVSNLKSLALAYQIWATDNNDRFPFHVSTNNGGSLELRHDIAYQFQILSNELSTPKLLICPGEMPIKREATNWPALEPSNISYFIGLSASEQPPHNTAPLSGDSAFHLNNTRAPSGLIRIRSTDQITFPNGLYHKSHTPNFVLGDGSVHLAATRSNTMHLLAPPGQTNTLLLP